MGLEAGEEEEKFAAQKKETRPDTRQSNRGRFGRGGAKSLGIQKCDGSTDLPTDTARCGVTCPRLKRKKIYKEHKRENWGRGIKKKFFCCTEVMTEIDRTPNKGF